MKKFAIFSTVMIIGAGIALAQSRGVPTSLDIPFYRDGATPARDTSGFIGVKNTSSFDQTITIVYTSLNASGNPQDLAVTYALGAFLGVQWRPIADVANEGPLGQAVPNNTIPGSSGGGAPRIVGSASIFGGNLVGMYRESDATNGNAFGHTV